jgi:hypothetical protein
LDVEVTPQALAFIQSHGGKVFLWTKDVDSAWESDELALEAPDGVAFDAYLDWGFALHIEHGIELPRRLKLATKRWPLRGLKVFWNGEPWGKCGRVVQEPGPHLPH